MPTQSRLRRATKHGARHINLGLNNQDAAEAQTFAIAAFGKTYHVGLVSDGCTGNPRWSRNEVGANLLTLYAYRRIQELVCSGIALSDIPKALYPSCTEFLLDLLGKIMPSHIVWKYDVPPKDREAWRSQTRFKNDYLSATLLGFITDGETLVIFSAGDGVILINDEIIAIDQNDQPDYLSVSINDPGQGFVVTVRSFAEVRRFAIMTDGLKQLVTDPAFVARLFGAEHKNPLALQFLFNRTFNDSPERMKDDCTAVTLEMEETDVPSGT